ncbi:flagellar brake domain-containing protein [Rheinheimera soli]|uniref:flagellar brake domain-containing protein n=1 Tax=Rheinheimera soli TaxID=443616 RepID=UPI001E429347|nr:flagellar brake protein [Rheinheimera soli]
MEQSLLSPVVHEKIRHLHPGSQVDLQFSQPSSLRIRTSLVGYEKNRYLVLKLPQQVIDGGYKDVFVEGNMTVVRCLLEGDLGECIAFRAMIKTISHHPVHLLFLEYPQQIENRSLRAKQRIRAFIPAYVNPVEQGALPETFSLYNGFVIDISPCGCRFSMKVHAEASQINKVQILMELLVPGEEERIQIPGEIMNCHLELQELSLGIKFELPERQVAKMLQRFIVDPAIAS